MALNNSLINTWGLKIRRTRLKQLFRFGIDFPIKSDPTERGTHFFHAPTFLLQCGMRMFVIRGARISCPESIARAWTGVFKWNSCLRAWSNNLQKTLKVKSSEDTGYSFSHDTDRVGSPMTDHLST